jgi:putative heme-binding domain-containing protein
VQSAGPVELPRLVTAFERSNDAEIGIRLVGALERSPGLASLPPEALRRTFRDYPDRVRQAAEPLFRRLELDTDKQRMRLAELESALAGGDSARGRSVFFGAHGGCASCHTIQSNGGKVGPDLSKIGAIRTGRDLLESIVFPSASFVRSYEPFVVSTTEGHVFSGYLSRETSDAIHLMLADRTERRIPRSIVDEFAPGRVSIMPQGLEAQLTRQELTDLIAYLVSLK